jgi:hypothetical protein
MNAGFTLKPVSGKNLKSGVLECNQPVDFLSSLFNQG